MDDILNILPALDQSLPEDKNLNESQDSLNRGFMWLIIGKSILQNVMEDNNYNKVIRSYIISIALFNIGQGIEHTLKGLLRICNHPNNNEHSNKKLNEELNQYYKYDSAEAVRKIQTDLINCNSEIVDFIDDSREFVYSKHRNSDYTKYGNINITDIPLRVDRYTERTYFLYITLVNNLYPNNDYIQKLVSDYFEYAKKLKEGN